MSGAGAGPRRAAAGATAATGAAAANAPGAAFRRAAAAALCASFAAVGALFLVVPDAVISLFDSWSARLGLATFGGHTDPFFVALAVAYMYLVTVFAWSMYRHPRDTASARLLVQAKLASAVLSFGLFFLRVPHLILLVNGIVDGSIGLLVLALFSRRATATTREGTA